LARPSACRKLVRSSAAISAALDCEITPREYHWIAADTRISFAKASSDPYSRCTESSGISMLMVFKSSTSTGWGLRVKSIATNERAFAQLTSNHTPRSWYPSAGYWYVAMHESKKEAAKEMWRIWQPLNHLENTLPQTALDRSRHNRENGSCRKRHSNADETRHDHYTHGRH
jgi:hypothetical protein